MANSDARGRDLIALAIVKLDLADKGDHRLGSLGTGLAAKDAGQIITGGGAERDQF